MGWWDLVTKWSCAICPQGCVSTFILLECLPQEWFAGLNCSFCQTVCVMVVWRTKVQCDAHGQVGGCKMDSLGWDGWCLLHKSEFFTICLILVEKLPEHWFSSLEDTFVLSLVFQVDCLENLVSHESWYVRKL